MAKQVEYEVRKAPITGWVPPAYPAPYPQAHIDSIKIKSPYTSDAVRNRLGVQKGIRYYCSGESYKEKQNDGDDGGTFRHAGRLKGSYENEMYVQVFEQEDVVHTKMGFGGDYTEKDVQCRPFVVIDGSAHKAQMGHNILGGPVTLHEAVKFLVEDLERFLGLPLPDYRLWTIERLDVSQCFFMGTEENVYTYLKAKEHVHFPQRKAGIVYPENRLKGQPITGRLWGKPNGRSSFKVYAKGPEFKLYGFKKYAERYGQECATMMQAWANPMLRFESHLRKPFLLQLTKGEPPTVMNLSMNDIYQKLFSDIEKINRPAHEDSKIVRTREAVHNRLRECESISSGMENTLKGLFARLITETESEIKASYKVKRTFQRHKAALIEAGIAWDGTELAELRDEVISNIVNFVPRADSPNRVHGELLEKYERMIADLELPTGLEANL